MQHACALVASVTKGRGPLNGGSAEGVFTSMRVIHLHFDSRFDSHSSIKWFIRTSPTNAGAGRWAARHSSSFDGSFYGDEENICLEKNKQLIIDCDLNCISNGAIKLNAGSRHWSNTLN